MVTKKDEKASLGSKVLNYVPWRTALTAAAFAVPVAGPILGVVVGTLAYGNYRKNNKEESEKESAQPDRLKKFLFRSGAIAIGFLFGGPIGAAVAGGLVAIDAVSNGKLIQGAEKILDAGYDALSWVKDKILDTGKWVVGKGREYEKVAENTAYSSDVELKSNEQDKKQETDKREVVGPFTQRLKEKLKLKSAGKHYFHLHSSAIITASKRCFSSSLIGRSLCG